MKHKRWDIEPSNAAERIQSDWTGDWLVLRCAGKNTLVLVGALAELGVRAWTPMWLRRRRYPRSSHSQSLLLPCLPSFVFMAEPDAVKALAAADDFGVPAFSLMNSYGVLVRVKDKDLEGLRKIADVNPRKQNPVRWPEVGAEQKVVSGAFQGMIVKVVGRTRRHCLVTLGEKSFSSVKIPPFLLADVDAESAQ